MAPSDAVKAVGDDNSDNAAHAKAGVSDIPQDDGDNNNNIMVPITREYLKNFYAQYPDPVLSGEFEAALRAVEAERTGLKLPALSAVPKRMDECMYAMRCECEESGMGDLIIAGECFEAFQAAQRAHVSVMVKGFLPADFRGWLFEVARQQSEAKNTAAVKWLMEKEGGSIRDKYALLWKQQWQRRETLSMVGNASGIWKAAVKFIAGVPQPLLDFARDINVPDGPTEELRCKFGPTLAKLVHAAMQINQLKQNLDNNNNSNIGAVLEEAASLVRKECAQFCQLLTEVVQASPFFVSPADILHSLNKEKNNTISTKDCP